MVQMARIYDPSEEENPLGAFLREERERQGIGIRELCRMTERNTSSGKAVSPSYYSQVETGTGIRSEKISMDFLWAVGVVLGVDPLKLFVLCRPQIPQRLVDAGARDRIFRTR